MSKCTLLCFITGVYNLKFSSLPDVNFIPYPNSYRCPYEIGYNNYELDKDVLKST